jgi:hypothetical protein
VREPVEIGQQALALVRDETPRVVLLPADSALGVAALAGRAQDRPVLALAADAEL